MAKKILIILSIFIGLWVFVIAAGFGVLYIGLPDSNVMIFGTDYISVPASLNANDLIIKIMSFNIRGFTREDKVEHNWDRRREHVVGLITTHSPDIIGLQEVSHIQFIYLIEQLGEEYGYAGISRSGMGLKRGDIFLSDANASINPYTILMSKIISDATVVFYKKSRFELISYQTLWMSETPEKLSRGWDAAFKRTTNKLVLKDHYSGEEFLLFNTHLDHRGVEARQESVNLFLDWANEADNVIAIGDFNIVENSTNYNLLISTALADSKYLSPEEASDTGSTFNGYGNYIYAPIDYIFVNPNYINALSYTIIRDRYDDNYYISDHYPIITEILIKH